MKRLLPSGPETEQPMPASGMVGAVVWRGGPGRTSAFEIMPSDKNIPNITITKYEEQLTVLMGVGQAVGDQRGDRAVAPRTDETHRARVLEEAGAGDKARHPWSILKYGQSSNFEYC